MAMATSVVIMAGGRGERFWPYSRADRPKQFLVVAGTGTLLQQTAARAGRLVGPNCIYVVTGAKYCGLVREQLPHLPPGNLIVEPVGLDTAPCIGLAALHLAARSGGSEEDVMVVLPADHLILKEEAFLEAMRTAVRVAGEGEEDRFVTVGLRPTRPETGYGYIRVARRTGGQEPCRVLAFTEKPDAERARAFLSSGEYLWNSGMFVWRVSAIQRAIANYLPELAQGLAPVREALGRPDFEAVLAGHFPRLPKVSIDYGVMEKAGNVWVVTGDFGWDDLGGWAALERVAGSDSKGNLAQGQAVLVDTEAATVRNDNPGKVVVAYGLRDTLVVDTPDVLLVAGKEKAADLKGLLNELRRLGLERYLHGLTSPVDGRSMASGTAEDNLDGLAREHPVREKPWGREVWWAVNERYAGKLLYVRAGQSLSRQYHREKSETMLFLRGEGRLELDSRELEVRPPLVVDIPAGSVHRIRAGSDLVILVVSSPELDDVVRLADDYGRVADTKQEVHQSIRSE